MRQRGFVLVLVLLGLALLALMLELTLYSARQASTAAEGAATTLRLQAAAQAGLTQALLRLTTPAPQQRWPINGTAVALRWDGVAVTVAITSEAGKFDLNQADWAQIDALFGAAGLNSTDADTLADRVLDWREPGTFRRLHGAKAAEYRAAGLNYAPRGAPFQTTSELQLVLGMTPLYAQLAPGITVYNVLPLPEPQTTPPSSFAL